MKIKVAATSTSCLDYYPEEHNIDIIRIKMNIDDKELLDGLDIKAEEFYEKLRNNPNWIPKTSQPSIGEMVDYFLSLANQGYTHAFVVTISSKLSGTYNSLYQASLLVKDKIEVIVFDSKTVCFSEGYIALEAYNMFKNNCSIEEVLNRLEYLKNNNTIFFAVDSLTQLVNNGRLSGAQAFFGKMLKIKPILQVQNDGSIVAIEKYRNIKKALKDITNKINQYTNGKDYYAHILYAGKSPLRDYFIKLLKEELNLENLYEAPATPVVGAHIGPDVIGIGIFIK